MDTLTERRRPSLNRDWKRPFRVLSPTRLRLGYRAIRNRCVQDEGFKRACTATVVTASLLLVVCPPLGLFALWFNVVYVMPRNLLEE